MLIKITKDMTESERLAVMNQNNLYLETGIMKTLEDGYNIDNLKINGKFLITNATGTLPEGYTSEDNAFFIENFSWFEHYGRQILHDIKTQKTYVRHFYDDVWQPYEVLTQIVTHGSVIVDDAEWYYEKWDDGRIKLYGHAERENVDISLTSGTVYRASDVSFELPDGLGITHIHCIIPQAGGDNECVWAGQGYYTSPTQICIDAICGRAVTTRVVFHIEVIGEWV